MTASRRAGGAALCALALPALLGMLLTLVLAPAAHAQGYRYWSFWTRDGGSWTYATQGPAVYRPADGDVLGFRFSVSPDAADDAARPRGTSGFEAICGGTAAKKGSQRVALVLDFGTTADAPEGETPPEPRTVCARVAEGATAADALAAGAKPLRYNSAALLCAIDGYPAAGCGERVSGSGHAHDGKAAASHTEAGGNEKQDGGSGTSTTLSFVVGAVLVAALGAGAVLQTRRRRG